MDAPRQTEQLIQAWKRYAHLVEWAPEVVADRLRVPVSLLTLINQEQSFILAAHTPVGMPPPREMPLTQTMCAEVARVDGPVVLPDLEAGSCISDSTVIDAFGLRAYAGIPIRNAAGEVIGALCAWDTKPREWSQDELDALAKYGDVLQDQLMRRQVEIELASACARLEQLDFVVPHEIRTPLTAIMGCLEMLFDVEVETEDPDRRFLIDMANRNGQRLLDFVDTMPKL